MPDQFIVTILDSGETNLIFIEDETSFVHIQAAPPLQPTDVYITVNEEIAANVVLESDVLELVSELIQGPAGKDGITSLNRHISLILNSSQLPNEISPGVISIGLPIGYSLNSSPLVMAFVDGRQQPEGFGWQPSTDGTRVELHLPTNPTLRATYLSAQPEFEIFWTQVV